MTSYAARSRSNLEVVSLITLFGTVCLNNNNDVTDGSTSVDEEHYHGDNDDDDDGGGGGIRGKTFEYSLKS